MGTKHGFEHYPVHIQRDVQIPDISLGQMLDLSVQKYGNHPALKFYDRSMTYSELWQSVLSFACALQQLGVAKGDRVAVMLPNCPQYIISYYGIVQAGAIVVQVNPMSVEREMEHILLDADVSVIMAWDGLYTRLASVLPTTHVEQVIVVSLAPTDIDVSPHLTFDAFLETGAGMTASHVDIHPSEDVAVLQYTGGTTGRPKGAMLTHRNLVANTVQAYEFFQDDLLLGQDRCLTVLPLIHVFGMTACMNLTLYTGSLLILLPRFEVEEVVKTIHHDKPTVFPGVPTMYVALTNYKEIEKYDLSSLRTCNSGGAPMPVGVLHQFERRTGAKILEGYGLSEASPVTHCNPPFAQRKAGTIGILYPSTECKVVDLDTGMVEQPIGEVGELVIRGPQVMKGYWNMPEETAHALRDGWLYTGDIVQMDESDYVRVVDRKKDLIIASGYNVYPRDIEEVLYEHEDVLEAVVVGVPDSYRGETVKAYIVLKAGSNVTVQEIEKHCKDNLAPYKVPKLFEFRDSLPKSSVGKILRRALRDMEAAKFTPPA